LDLFGLPEEGRQLMCAEEVYPQFPWEWVSTVLWAQWVEAAVINCMLLVALGGVTTGQEFQIQVHAGARE
jgi:hypothetical protein